MFLDLAFYLKSSFFIGICNTYMIDIYGVNDRLYLSAESLIQIEMYNDSVEYSFS